MALVQAALPQVRNRGVEYPFRQDSYFHYLTGFDEPGAFLAVSSDPFKTVLFCQEKDKEAEMWTGERLGPEAAKERLGVDESWPVSSLDEKMPELLAGQKRIACLLDPARLEKPLAWKKALLARKRDGVKSPQEILDLALFLDPMRQVKDGQEIALMREAARISAKGHLAAMKAARPGVMEYEIEAEILYHFKKEGSAFPAYWPIVAGGRNACVLHYTQNRDPLPAGSLLLIDAGAEYRGYAADITRTFPADGRFSGPQGDLYQVVLLAQEAAIKEIAPGKTVNDYHEAATRVLVEGMVHLGLLEGEVEEIIETQKHKKFYPHRTGHWLGMDVHDCGSYREEDGSWKRLSPGMVLTVEPGIYVREGEGPEHFWNMGIRIEDDVLVTEDGHEVLTSEVPKAISDIEAFLRV